MYLNVIFVILALQNHPKLSRGQLINNFLSKYSNAIETYIMTGYGGGWKSCDILAAGRFKEVLFGENANLHVNIETLVSYDISVTTLASYCLLIVSKVQDVKTLNSIVEFGWKATHYKRIGMVLNLENNVTLSQLKNTTKIPFLIASQFSNDQEQFLCPVVGELEPALQSVMCDQSYTNYKGKLIRISLWPYFNPYATFDKKGKPAGVDIEFLKLLQRKMKFIGKVIISAPRDIVKMVNYSVSSILKCEC